MKCLHCSLWERPCRRQLAYFLSWKILVCLLTIEATRKTTAQALLMILSRTSLPGSCTLPFGDSHAATLVLKSSGWLKANLCAVSTPHRTAPLASSVQVGQAEVWATQHAESRITQKESFQARDSPIKPRELHAKFLISRTWNKTSTTHLHLTQFSCTNRHFNSLTKHLLKHFWRAAIWRISNPIAL
jgi:hypothetical protein